MTGSNRVGAFLGVVMLLILAMLGCRAPTSGASGAASPGAARETPTQRTAEAAAPMPRTTVKVAYVPVLAFAPLYRAIAKGYFDEVGIDVDLQVVQSASDAIAFLGTGQMDVALGNVGAPFFNAINRDIPVRLVAGNSSNQRDPAALAAAPLLVRRQLMDEGAVRTPADLKGRVVAINAPAGIQEYSMARILAREQLRMLDVEIKYLAFPEMLTAFTSGAIDAAILAEPFSAAAREGGAASVLVGNPVPGAVVTAVLFGESLLKPENESPGRRFLEAMRRAANELQSEREIFADENLAIWTQYTGVPEQRIKQGAPYAYARNLILDVGSVLDQQQYLLREQKLDYQEPLPETRIMDPRFLARS